jgi:hypothetical protein
MLYFTIYLRKTENSNLIKYFVLEPRNYREFHRFYLLNPYDPAESSSSFICIVEST